MKYKYYIGIDPGIKTGICVWSPVKFILSIETMPIHKALREVRLWNESTDKNIFVRLEDARLRKWIPKQKTLTAELGRREGAGYVKAHCQIWEEFLKDNDIPYEAVAPKNNKTKVNQQYFNKLSGFTGTCSQHARDAGMLVVGF